MEASSAEKLLEAFRVLDVDGKGSITKEYLGKLMVEEGEPFTQVNIISVSSQLHSYYLFFFFVWCRRN